MPLFCPHCAYENDVHYRFCGMCGTPLTRAAAEESRSKSETAGIDRYNEETGEFSAPSSFTEEYRSEITAEPTPATHYSYEGSPSQRLREETRPISIPRSLEERGEPAIAPRAVSGPSFLGLSSTAEPETHYLLEDDAPPAGRRRMALALVLLLIAAVAVGWRWYSNGMQWVSSSKNPSQYGVGPSNQPSYSENGAPMPSDNSTHLDKPKTGMGDIAELPSSDTPNPPPNSKNKPRETDLPASNRNPAGDGSVNSSNAGPEATPSSSEASNDRIAVERAAKEALRDPPVAAIHPVNRPDPAPAKSLPEITPSPAAAPTDSDILAAEGERYLYGTGVRQDCSRAQKSLLAAAARSNAHAETLLGAMHATGHCVDRDLPSAYRWFAKALHQEPRNGRVARDLEILWRQMSPEERQLASANQ